MRSAVAGHSYIVSKGVTVDPQSFRSKPKKKSLSESAKLRNAQALIAKREKLRLENEAQAETIRRHRAELEARKAAGIRSIDGNLGDEWMDFFPSREDYRRYDAQNRATPKWSDRQAIEEIYQERDRLNESKPADRFAVDHYYPILGKTVCGLHVPDNLRIIRHSENSIKNNKHPDDL